MIMDHPNQPNMFGTPEPEPQRIDPPGGFAHLPPAAPDPADGSTAPMTGDVPPMRTPDTVQRFDPWNYREQPGLVGGVDLVGYRVEATDGHIGKIDQASAAVGDSWLVVDTGPWIFGKKVLLPAGTVCNVDADENRVYVDRTKAQIKDAPEYDPERTDDPAYRDKLGDYYGGTYPPVAQTIPQIRPATEGSGPDPETDYPR
jgi:hypothetical protein